MTSEPMPGFPHRGHPEGWFCVGWSEDFPPATVTRMRNFDLDLVAYRGEEGQLIVMDAYCPHMGANLGVGGTIEGSCLRCPFRRWA